MHRYVERAISHNKSEPGPFADRRTPLPLSCLRQAPIRFPISRTSRLSWTSSPRSAMTWN